MEIKPILITNVSTSYYSVTRHYGEATIQGEAYVYCPERDILIKRDWWKVYKLLKWDDFLSALSSGEKPPLSKTAQYVNNNNSPTPSLFD